MAEVENFQISEILILKLKVCLHNINNFKFKLFEITLEMLL